MNSLAIFAYGLSVLAVVSVFQPMRGWLRNLFSQSYLLLFVVPIFVLFGWPIDNLESFREGSDLGWHRVARIILFAGFFGFIVFSSVYSRRFIVPRSSVFAMFALYTLFAAMSSLYSHEPLQSLWKAFELLVVLMFALKVYASHSQPEHVVGLVNALLYLAFSLCLMSLVGGYLAPELAWRDFGLAGLGTRSMNGVVPSVNANMLGQLGGIVALVGLFRLLVSAGSRRLGDWLVPIIGISALFLAYSRTSLITFVLLLILLIFLLYRRDLSLLVVSTLFGVGVLFMNVILEFLYRGQDQQQFASMSGRGRMWELALDSWHQSPWVGHGFFVGHKYVKVGHDRFLETVDSTYVETLVNLGIVGLVLIVAFALGALRLAWQVLEKCRNKRQDMLQTAIVLFIFVGFIIVRSITASSFQVLHYNLLFLLLAIAALHGLKLNVMKG